jgi:hypothetical protein
MSQTLLHIGFAKSGSTYLQQWFEKHPAMYFQPKHIAGGFYHGWELAKYAQNAGHAPENYVISCDDISIWKGDVQLGPNDFSARQGDSHILGLRGTAPYDYRSYQNMICEMLYGIYPTAKILIVTRGYTTIFKSIYAQYIGMSGTFTFAEMTAANPGMFTTLLDYTFVIELYRKKFGHNNVIVLPYELLRDDLPRFLSLIEQQLNITEKFESDRDKVNAAMDDKILYVYRYVSRLVYGLLKPLPLHVGAKFYGLYMKLVMDRKLHNLFAGISRKTDKKINLEGLDEIVASMKGKAEVLREEPLYQPYLKEYLL